MTQDDLRRALARSRAPRYTSYPPANRFGPAIGPADTAEWLARVPAGDAVSLYVHLPFCRRLCWFCACRTQGTRSEGPLIRYLDHLETEIALVRARLPDGVGVSQLHLGGGTPTLLSPALLTRLAEMLRAFPIEDAREVSVEIDPCEFGPERLKALLSMGLTRGSLGVQDFDPVVQRAIGRFQDFEVTQRAMRLLREAGIGSVNMDLLFGLPHQSQAKLGATVDQVLDLGPDRIALYGYAHVPWMARRQNLICEQHLPDAEERLDLEALARERLTGAGYVAIGIDHYALPGDSMAKAARAGILRRNFQGYTTDTARVLIGMGASAISRYPEGYAQNVAATGAWQEMLGRESLATARGFRLGPEERAIGAVIEGLMCEGAADIDAQCRAQGLDPAPILARARRVLKDLPGAAVEDEGRIRLASFAYARPIAAGIEDLSTSETMFSRAV